jgi:hypothetical protein
LPCCGRNPLLLSEKLIELINNPLLLENIASNGYHKFLQIYDKNKIDFQEFIYKIDNNGK